MNKFTAGARVRHVDHPNWGVGIVTSLYNDNGHIEIKFENRKAGWTTYHGGERHYEFLPPVLKVGDTVLVCDRKDRSDRAFYYDREFSGKRGRVDFVDDTNALITAEGFKYNQYIPLADLTLVKVDPVEAVKKATPKVKTISFKKGSQCDRIVKYLLAGNSITPLVARQLFGAERLAARVLEIKRAGHKVRTETKTDVNGKVYAEYSLRNVGRVAA